MKDIKDLNEKQKEIWRENNEKYFGITPISSYSNAEIVNKKLEETADKFWNNGTNEFKKLLEDEGKLSDFEYMIPGSYKLIFDQDTSLIYLSGNFNLPDNYKHSRKALKEAREQGLEKPLTRRINIAIFPSPDDLGWIINSSKYVLRINAHPNYDLIRRDSETEWAQQNNWKYNSDTDEYWTRSKSIDPFGDLDEDNIFFLSEVYGQEVTRENFKDALKSMPIYDKYSAAYFKYDYVDTIFDFIKGSKRFANPLKYVPVSINVAKVLTNKRTRENNYSQDKDESTTSMIISPNNIFSLEMSRTIVFDSKFNSSFSFSDTRYLFDAFKTSTNKAAGRTRLLLDNITAENGLLWFTDENGNKISQYKAAFELESDVENLSAISNSSFNTNNDPKRIMMTAKLRAQAVPIVGEENDFSHEIPARIVFGDFEGFNYGDSLVISRSFARRLTSVREKRRNLVDKRKFNYLNHKYDIGDVIEMDDYRDAIGTTADDNFRNIVLKELTIENIIVEAELPFGVGDKITNFHGSKGIVSLILEDEDMPYLENDLGPNMKKGPVDVIASGLSVYRRKSPGQIFEAYAMATGHTDVNNAHDLVNKYYDDIQEYGEKSVVRFQGTRVKKPLGINMFIRLSHDSVTKQSFSELKSNSFKMLKFGEMELLNLASQDLGAIINEFDLRSLSKHADSMARIKKLQEDRQDVYKMSDNLKYFNIFRSLGINIDLGQKEVELEDGSLDFLSNMNFVNDDILNEVFDN